MPEAKTKITNVSPASFIDSISDEAVRDDCHTISKLMEKVTGFPPKMWGPSIIGFGKYHYKYESGHEGDSCLAGFSPRKANITLYVKPNEQLMGKLGKHKAGKGCIYIKKLSDIDVKILTTLLKESVAFLRETYSETSRA